ncbi:hypothetical protein PHLCEN_2v10040 [Hermanssonia centrifuga]|uniref:Uncharacterized protein n=1 Tax=Hermanssonia centrifuga TaxID=98765 RepID=A0A2R6NP50_9APHY|nr:hypothetical protein PHLCEN_2v10040 [Hermanssonia centrifuga]
MSTALQMARGNLELRPLVMEIVKQDIDTADYAKAFAAWSISISIGHNEPGLVEDAVKYVIFLVGVDKLFDANDAVNCTLDAVTGVWKIKAEKHGADVRVATECK